VDQTGRPTQRIPLGAASPHVVRRYRAWRGRSGAGVLVPVILAVLGVAAALAGAAFYAAEPEVDVRLSAESYRVAGHELVSQGGGAYQGAAGALVIERRGSELASAASTTIAGQPVTGRCLLAVGAGREACDFSLGTRVLTASDTRSAAGWSRHYSDGTSVSIRVDGDPDTPVPFPVGR
jgi:hypothetical protein